MFYWCNEIITKNQRICFYKQVSYETLHDYVLILIKRLETTVRYLIISIKYDYIIRRKRADLSYSTTSSNCMSHRNYYITRRDYNYESDWKFKLFQIFPELYETVVKW